MTVEELYAQIDGNYADVLARLGMEQFVARFIVKYVTDASVPNMLAAWEAGDEHACFEAAHAAKGVCGNLSLSRLQQLSSTICEALREGNDELRATTDVDALIQETKAVHEKTVAGINAFTAQ